jgi:hypothetical protein
MSFAMGYWQIDGRHHIIGDIGVRNMGSNTGHLRGDI